jgi:hypothetical protein
VILEEMLGDMGLILVLNIFKVKVMVKLGRVEGLGGELECQVYLGGEKKGSLEVLCLGGWRRMEDGNYRMKGGNR